MKTEHQHNSGGHHDHSSHQSVWDEVMCHFPYAIFSAAVSMICLSFIPTMDGGAQAVNFSHRLFHNFHYLHLLFAGTGTILMFRRYSKNIPLGILIGFSVPAVFCTLSDALLPYIGGKFVALDMHFHWCFISHLDTVLPFLLGGFLNGWVLSSHASSKQMVYSIWFHFSHIFISCMASILYLVSFGFHNWSDHMGFVFTYLIFAVLFPCTLSDVVVPMLCAKVSTKKK